MRSLIPLAVSILLAGMAPANSAVGIVVAEEIPSCDHFVVATNDGYSLLEWYGGVVGIWEDDVVRGDFESYGFTDVVIEGRGEMRVWVEDYWVNEQTASEYFYGQC